MKQIEKLKVELNNLFPERRDAIEASLAGVLAEEHVLLVGPPGTAKSALCRAIALAFGGSYFEWLVGKYTTPEELYGPVSLRALEQDRFLRVTTGKLPEANIVFLDEVFKASSAILNTLLGIANERVFHNDGVPVPVPLVSMFGASNELPDREGDAVLDRFLVKIEVGYVLRPTSMRAVLSAGDLSQLTTRMSLADLKRAQAEVAQVKVTDATVDALLVIRDTLKADGVVASDRRWKKALKLVQATAYLAGEKETTPEDLVVLTHVLWRETKEKPRVARVVGSVADPARAQAEEILTAAREATSRVQALAKDDRKTFVSNAAQTLEELKQQERKLAQLGKSAGKRAVAVINQAQAEVTSLHSELARAVSHGLGLGMRAVK